MLFQSLAKLAALLVFAPLQAEATPGACRVVNFTVSGTAQNLNLTGVPTGSLADLQNFAKNAPRITINGTQTLAGTYCEPFVKNANNKKLEVFFHSIVAGGDTWNALGGPLSGFPPYQPERYSWTRFANLLGYPTLAIDRLGNGKSSHPDPILVVQAPYETELYYDLSKQLRSGKTLGVAYNHLIWVGNSYGSQLGAEQAGAHPTAYDEYIVTGYTNNPQQDFLGVSLVLPAPAAVAVPARFGGLSPGYLTATSKQGQINSFFGSKAQVSYSDVVAGLFFDRRDTVSVGQFVSVYALPFFAGGFKGRVLDLTGEQDQAFCGPGSPVLGPAMCGDQLKNTRVNWPDSQYNYKSVNRTGHAIQLHDSAQKVFTIAHLFLAGQNFQGGPPAKL